MLMYFRCAFFRKVCPHQFLFVHGSYPEDRRKPGRSQDKPHLPDQSSPPIVTKYLAERKNPLSRRFPIKDSQILNEGLISAHMPSDTS
ncbi:hypothetical protein TNIN_382651 [Trichonephila inaurata madagascariensis]|uniref:Uncharacterized protein n=1 Tax=Trichonephila inaurata madagascariensis TaxID=2747483 RepID=A0A8X6X766_9ARAC|nr:hypothetical protein TNIN_382651 [Trichonephila inaurata madagascariensis]